MGSFGDNLMSENDLNLNNLISEVEPPAWIRHCFTL